MDHQNPRLSPAVTAGDQGARRAAAVPRARHAAACLLMVVVAACLGHPACRGQEAPAGAPPAGGELLADLPQGFLDVIARKALAASLRSAQVLVIDHLLSTDDLSPASREQIAAFRGDAGGPSRDRLFISLEGRASERERDGEWGVWLLDVGALEARAAADPMPCPELRTESGTAAEAHNLIALLVRNVHRLCGEPVEWRPARSSRLWETFALLDAEARFDTFHLRYQDPGATFGVPSLFGEESRFWTAIHFLYLQKSVEARCFRLVRNEFLTPRQDLEEKYPEMEYLRHDLSYIVWARLTGC